MFIIMANKKRSPSRGLTPLPAVFILLMYCGPPAGHWQKGMAGRRSVQVPLSRRVENARYHHNRCRMGWRRRRTRSCSQRLQRACPGGQRSHWRPGAHLQRRHARAHRLGVQLDTRCAMTISMTVNIIYIVLAGHNEGNPVGELAEAADVVRL